MKAENVGSGAAKIARYVGYGALFYVLAIGVYSLFYYSATKDRLLTFGTNESTAHLLAIGVMLIAIALPLRAAFRIIALRGRSIDYVAVMILPMITWGTRQLPASFSGKTGEVLEYCAERPDGEPYCRDHAGFDPLTGASLEPVTREDADTAFRRGRGMIPQRIDLPFNQMNFFDSLDGRPLVWIRLSPDGCFEAFNNRGMHPVEGTPLIPVTREHITAMRRCLDQRAADAADQEAARRAVTELAEQREAREREEANHRVQLAEEQAYREKYTLRGGNPVLYGIAVSDGEIMDTGFEQAFANEVQNSQARPFLRQAALSNGVFQRIYEGDANEFARLRLDAIAGQLLVGSTAINYTENKAVSGAINANATLEVRLLDSTTGAVIDGGRFAVSVLGYNTEDARQKAQSKLAQDVSNQLTALGE